MKGMEEAYGTRLFNVQAKRVPWARKTFQSDRMALASDAAAVTLRRKNKCFPINSPLPPRPSALGVLLHQCTARHITSDCPLVALLFLCHSGCDETLDTSTGTLAVVKLKSKMKVLSHPACGVENSFCFLFWLACCWGWPY